MIKPVGSLNYSYDETNDVLTVEGIKYSGDMFRYHAFEPCPGRWMRAIAREDGIVHVEIKKDQG